MNEVSLANEFNIIVDRIEGDFAVCEFPDMTMKDIRLSDIPFEVKEKNTLVAIYTDSNELKVLSLKRMKKTKRTAVKLIRFT